MKIEGRSLQEWMNEPAGKFTQAVRKNIDPNWGRECDSMKSWKCKVKMYRTESETANLDIEAFTEIEARDKAFEEVDGDDWDDVEIDAREVEIVK